MSKVKSKKESVPQIIKRNAVVAAVVLFVCAAVYLNWDYEQTGKNLGDAALVGAETGDPLLDGATEITGTEEVGKSVDSAAYFANARLNRQQARDNALNMLQETLVGENTTETVKEQTGLAIETMAGQAMTEAQIENLVVAKGYADCVAIIGQDSVNVVVQGSAGELTRADTAKIMDIVSQNTNFTADRIKIIPVN